MVNIIEKIRKDLNEKVDEKTRISGQNFFKEKIKYYGVRTTEVRKIGKSRFKEIKDLPKKEVWDLCEELWESGYLEESFIACHWSYSLRKEFEPVDFNVFEKWVNRYVNNWASCDTLCNHTVGDFLEKFPEYVSKLPEWAGSDNRWVRRAAAVSLIIPAKKGKFFPFILKIADLLLADRDDLVQKGCGWMLKSASIPYPEAIFEYVIKYKEQMSRTTLRYAIEKMPDDMRKQAMQRE